MGSPTLQAGGSRTGGLSSLTVGARGSRYGGYLRFGDTSAESGLHAGFYYDGRDHDRHGHRYYGRGHYYHHYRPIRYYGCGYYRPYYGYTYASVYYADPYYYPFHTTNVYYVDGTADGDSIYYPVPDSSVGETQVQPAPDTTYQVLTDPGDLTLVGQGNAAFLAGRYDQARRLYASAMLADERDGYAKLLYALANFAIGDYAVSGMAIRRALLTTPELVDYPVDVRSLYEDPVPFNAQLEKLTRYVADHPEYPSALLLLGYIEYAAGAPERAAPILQQLSTADPDDSLAVLLRDAALRAARGAKPGE